MRRSISILALSIAIALTASVGAASLQAAAQQPRKGGTIVVAIASNPPSLNPHLTTLPGAVMVGMNVFNSLVWVDQEFRPHPDLAEWWTVSSDKTTYVFRLVRNATWHDGMPVTSADVKFTFEEVVKKVNAQAPALGFPKLIGVDTPDDHTAILRFSKPHPSLLFFLDVHLTGAILPKHIYAGTDIRKNEANLKPIGSGPFKFVDFVKGDRITLVKNENHWRRDRPLLDRIVFKIVPDAAARTLTVEKGEADMLLGFDLPIREIPRLKTLRDLVVDDKVAAGIAGQFWMGFNLRHPILKDLRVRQAIAHAIDKKVILEQIFFGQGAIATAPVSSDIKWAYNPNVPKHEFDVKRANQLLDDAGFPRKADGTRFKLTFVFDSESAEFAKIGEVMREQLKAVGIDLAVQSFDFATWNDKVLRKWDFELSRGRRLTGPDPAFVVARDFLSAQITPGARNWMGYNNSRVDALFVQAQTEPDEKKRVQALFELQEIIARELPNIFFVDQPQPNLYNKNFVGLSTGPYGQQRLENVWWTQGTPLPPPPPAVRTVTATVTQPVTVTQRVEVPQVQTQVDIATIGAAIAITAVVVGASVGVVMRRRA